MSGWQLWLSTHSGHSRCTEHRAQSVGSAKNMMEVYKQTAEATDTSVATVRRIVKEVKESESQVVFRTPGKKRPREHPVTDVDVFDQGFIKRCIHNYHLANKSMPTVEKLRKKLREDINFQGSERSLRRVIKMLGFDWKKTDNNRKILIEKSNLRFQRIKYLQQIKKIREEGRTIVYADESYVDSSHSSPPAGSDGSTKVPKKPSPKGQRLVIVHAATETGFVPNALLTFIAGTKSGDYQDTMNYENYEKWLCTQLIPNIPPKSVLVIDNTSYHNRQYHPAPSSNAEKSEMLGWLSEKGIHHDKTMLKPQLYNLIKINRDKYKAFQIDKVMAEHGHDVLRLPPYHPELTPMEMVWPEIKGYVGSKSGVALNASTATDLIKEKVDLMGAEWAKLYQKVKDIEKEYIKNDKIVDDVTEEFVICPDDDETESDSEDDDEEVASTSTKVARVKMLTVAKGCDVPGCSSNTDLNPNMIFITLPPNRQGHSKWLKKTFGDIEVDDPGCQIVCEQHADPQFMRIIRSRHQPVNADSSESDEPIEDPCPGPSMKTPGRNACPGSSAVQASAQAEFVSVAGAPNMIKQEPYALDYSEIDVVPRNLKHSGTMADHVAAKRVRLDDSLQPMQDDENFSYEIKIKEELIIEENPDTFEAELLPSVICEDIQMKRETPDAIKSPSFDFGVEIKMEEDSFSGVPNNIEDTPIKIDQSLVTLYQVKEEAIQETSDNSADPEHIKKEDDVDENIEDTPIRSEQSLMAQEHSKETKEIPDSLIYLENCTPNKLKFDSITAVLENLIEMKFINRNTGRNIINVSREQKLALQSFKFNYSTVEFAALSLSMKSFAIMLYVYCPMAYEYVRNRYKIPLLLPCLFRDWLIMSLGHAGFTRETLEAIKEKATIVKQQKSNNHKIFVCLDLKHVNVSKSIGQGRIQQPPLDWMAKNATSALTLTAVALNADWKMPIGYFWTNVVAGPDLANLVQVAIGMLEKVGVEPVAVTFDYYKDNLQMCTDLNCCIDKVNLKTSFLSESGKPIFLFPDPRKVIEGMYTDMKFLGSIVDANLQVVDLNQILLLVRKAYHEMDSQQALRKAIATEMCKKHLSSDLEPKSGALTFFKNLHVVLDVLFSRKGGFNLKNAIAKATNVAKNPTVAALQEAGKYFKSLKLKDPTRSLWITDSGRIILGLCALIDSALMLIFIHSSKLSIEFGNFIGSTYYLANLTHQDHTKNNPTTFIFRNKYKKMLRDEGPLHWSGGSWTIENLALLTCKSAIDRINLTTNLPNGKLILHVQDDLKKLLRCKIAEFEDTFVVYVAQFVTYSVVSQLKCEMCIRALRLKPEKAIVSYANTRIKTPFAVKLDEPSTEALGICKTSEAAFQKAVKHTRGKALNCKFNVPFLLIKVMKKYVGRPLFESVTHHQFDTDRTCNHVVELAKAIAETYLKTRIHHY